MTANKQSSPQTGRVATVVATAAVTVAIGTTIAAAGGYLVPYRNGEKPDTTGAPPAAGQSVQARGADATSQPDVVLVPVAEAGQPPQVAAAAPIDDEAILAAYEAADREVDRDDDDWHERSEHGHRRHEDEHDDD